MGLNGEVQALLRARAQVTPSEMVAERVARMMSPAETLAPLNGKAKSWQKPEIFTAEALDAVEIPAVKWAVRGLLPAGLGIIAGRPKIGKSWFTLALGLSVALGRKFLGRYEVEQGEVLLLALEDPKRRLQDRLRKQYAGANPPAALHLAREWPRLGAGAMEEVRSWVDAHPHARLVIVDTLQKVRGRRERNENAYAADYEAMEALKATADARGIALLIVHHTRKADADDPIDSVSGTLGIAGGVDSLFILKRDRGADEADLIVTGRDIEDLEIALRWDALQCAWNAVGLVEEVRITDERKQIIGVLSSSGGALKVEAIAEKTGGSNANVKKLLADMAKDGQVSRVTRGVYALPNHPTPVTGVTTVTPITGVTGDGGGR